MTSIQIIALILIIISLIKIVVIFIKPALWYGDKNPLIRYWMKAKGGVVISLALGVLVLSYLLKELSITQIFATTAFLALFMMIAFAPYAKHLYEWVNREASTDSDIFRHNWIALVLWLGLVIWVLVDIFLN